MNILEAAGFTIQPAGGNCTAYMRKVGEAHWIFISEAYDIPEAPIKDGPCFVSLQGMEYSDDLAYREVASYAEAVDASFELVARYGGEIFGR